MIGKLLVVMATSSLLFACHKAKVKQYDYWAFNQPSYFPETVYTFQNNKLTYPRIDLGRYLFYDADLSIDSTVSCATCHHSAHGFAGHNTPVSAGVNNLVGTRNSPTIINMAWSKSFMWDGGINHIEVMPIAPFTNPVEMNISMAELVQRVGQSPKYKQLFKRAYGTETVTDQLILRALAQFLSILVSDQTKYDRVIRGEDHFTSDEQSGYALFQQKCAACHTEPLFTDRDYHNNGLDATWTSETGRHHVTQDVNDMGKFKVPTLRNVELTYPYMHDGRFMTLNQVLEHYNSGVQSSATLDPLLQNGIPLTNLEKYQLVAFLKTLTDYSMMTNSLFAEPKK